MSDAIAAPPAPAPAPAAPPAPTTTPTHPTPESGGKTSPEPEKPVTQEISDGIKSLLKDRLKGKPTPPKEEKPKEEKPKVEKAKEEKPKEEKPKEEKKEVKVTRKAAAPAPDIRAITTEAATAAVRAAMDVNTLKKPPGTPTPPSIETEIAALPEEYREDVPVLKRMEEKWPEKYRGLTDKYVQASSKIEQYRTRWEKDNPGYDFNPDEAEHAAFIEANEIDWNDRDYGRALASIETESAMDAERKKVTKKLDEVEGRMLERDLEPTIRNRQSEVAKDLITKVDKDFATLIEANGTISKTELDRLRDVDSFRVDTLLAATSEVARFVDATERIFHPSGKFQFDEANPNHMAVAQFLIDNEDAIQRGGEKTQVTKDGRTFVTRAEWTQLSEGQRRSRWRLEAPDLVYLKQRQQEQLAKKRIEEWDERFNKMVSARGYVKGQAQPIVPDGKAKPSPEKPAAAKPNAPAATESVKVDTSGGGATKGEPDFRAKLKAALRGGSIR